VSGGNSGGFGGFGRFGGLHVLADDHPRWPRNPVQQARAACAGGAQVVQLRAKHCGDAQALAWAREIRQLTQRAGLRFVVNDRFDWALLAEADGVHLGQSDLPPAALPAEARARLAIGRSSHSLAEARRACAEGADYVAFGPLFQSASKRGRKARGLSRLREAARAVKGRPLIAIGGIGAEEAAQARRAGAAGVAVIAAVAGAANPAAATQRLLRALQQAQRGEAA